LGLRPVLLAARRHLDGVISGVSVLIAAAVQLVAVEAPLLGLAPVPHSQIVHRQDAVLAGAAVKTRDAVLIDVEILADELAQQRVGLADGRLVESSPGARSTARSARSASSATRVRIRSRCRFSRQRQSGFSTGLA
jgi:hypothetical protein